MTSDAGFRVAVAQVRESPADSGAAGPAALQVYRGIPDQRYATAAQEIHYMIPTDAFAHTNDRATVTITAVQVDGTPIPVWLRFDPAKGDFKGIPPAQFKGEIAIRVIAKDDNGSIAETQFRIRVGDPNDKTSHNGKPSLTSQLRHSGFAAVRADRERFVGHARSIAQARSARLS